MGRGLRIGHPAGSTYALAAAQGAFALTGQAASLAYSGDGDSFTSDPYSAYSTRLVDPAVASDAAGGTTATRTWNGVSQSWQVYKTLGFAVTDYAGASRRLGLLKSTTYTPASDVTFPTGGSSDSARFVIQGDPTATDAEMPVIALGTNSGNSVAIRVNDTNSADWVTFRKLDISGQVDLSSSPGQIFLENNANSCEGLVVEYCKLHGYQQPSGANNGGSVVCHNAQNDGGTPTTIRFCKIYDNVLSGGGYNDNICGVIGDSVDSVVVENCEFTNMGQAVFNKFPGSATGWKVRKSIFQQINRAFVVNGGAGGASTGHEFSGNLCYNAQADSYAIDARDGNQCGRFDIFSNTFAEDFSGAFALARYSDARIHSNAALTDGGGGQYKFSFETATMTLTECDYNAFFGSMNFRANGATYASVAAWKAASGAMVTNPDANGLTISSLASAYTNTAARDYSLKAGSQLIGAGKGGIDIGHDDADCGAGW